MMKMIARLISRIIPVCIISLSLCFAVATQAQDHAVGADMVLVPAGIYTPLYKNLGDSGRVEVPAFYIDTYPVTNAE